MQNKKHSEMISDFLDYIKSVTDMYNGCNSQMKEEDKLTQDILHKFELEELDYKERNRLGTLLKTNRKNRRYYKDQVELLQPIVDFVNNNKKTLDVLKQILGEVRKTESYHSNRTYHPKVMKEKIKVE